MKKYIISLTAALCLSVAPAMAQEKNEAAGAASEQVTYTMTVTPEGDAVEITESTSQKTVEVDTATYKDYVNKGYSDSKIFKNQLITESDNSGMGVTLMSMCIVLLALILLSLLFLFFGKLFAKNQSRKKSEAQGRQEVSEEDDHDSGEVIAAIAMALDEHFNSKHDLEDTVLTIRRMKRAYSPWNSKIYNMREVPALRRKR